MSEQQAHEFTEDIDDGSMCVCGIPSLTHDAVVPTPAEHSSEEGGEALSEAERDALPFGPAFYPAVERILADRLAAVQAERDKADAYAARWYEEFTTAEAERDDLRGRLAAVEAELVMPLFDAVTKAASPDDWARHLPNCGYSDDGPVCGCADYGSRLMAAIKDALRAALANPSAAQGEGDR